MPFSSLAYRASGHPPRAELGQYNRKLTDMEELTLTQWILSMDLRGYPPRVCAVQHMAELLLHERVPGAHASIGKNWTTRFINQNDELKSKFTHRYDYQRALCEDPDVINAWFRLIRNTIQKYGIDDADIYNFDETGFAIGVAATTRVVTGTERRRGKALKTQPGNRE